MDYIWAQVFINFRFYKNRALHGYPTIFIIIILKQNMDDISKLKKSSVVNFSKDYFPPFIKDDVIIW